MDRRVQWVLAVVLITGLAYAVFLTHYDYPPQAVGRLRIDRWTGVVQTWQCDSDTAGRRVLERFRARYPDTWEDTPGYRLAQDILAKQSNVSDQELARAILAKWPEYQDFLGEIASGPHCGWKAR